GGALIEEGGGQVSRGEIAVGAGGVVVMHGTDTMQYSASARSFRLDSPVPIVFTGSQRSADRPSSDNVMTAVCAVEAAKADHAETLVCMHASQSDDACALHRGTRVRKNHTSRRDAFETVGGAPLGRIDYEAAAEWCAADRLEGVAPGGVVLPDAGAAVERAGVV
uniref:asparaginase domain-containing protein n=1 Tax=Halorubrum lacusprofundi TaxID=2247 RepID=UPI001F5BE817